MTNTELNYKVAEKLGIEWHSVKNHGTNDDKVCPLCTCGKEFITRGDLYAHVQYDNPDFTLNAKNLIEVLMKRDDWIFFREEIGTWNCYGGKNVWVSRISLDYILNPRLLCEEYLKWEGK